MVDMARKEILPAVEAYTCNRAGSLCRSQEGGGCRHPLREYETGPGAQTLRR